MRLVTAHSLRPLGDAEVEHLGGLAVVVLLEEDVLGLEVAVDHAERVRAGQRAGSVSDQTMCAYVVEPTVTLETRRERLAAQVLHGDEGGAVPSAVVVDVHHVGATELGFDPSLALESGQRIGLVT